MWWDYCLAAYVEASNLVSNPYRPEWNTTETMAAGWDRVLDPFGDYGLSGSLFEVAVAAYLFLCPEGDPDDWDGYRTRNSR